MKATSFSEIYLSLNASCARLRSLSRCSSRAVCLLFHRVRSLQHVHTCLLKQSSSAKKAPSSASAAVNPAPRTPAEKRYSGAGGSGYGNKARAGVGETGPSAPGQGQDGEFPGPDDTTDSPRSTRVSLQGVFSPKVGSNEFIFGKLKLC